MENIEKRLKLADVDVNLECEKEDADKGEVEKRMNDNGDSTCLKITKLNVFLSSRQLKQKPWREHHEEYHRH